MLDFIKMEYIKNSEVEYFYGVCKWGKIRLEVVFDCDDDSITFVDGSKVRREDWKEIEDQARKHFDKLLAERAATA